MNENSKSKNEVENEGSLMDINNYINNNILNFPLSRNFNKIIEMSSGNNKKKITLHTLEKKIFAKFNIKYKIKYNPTKIYNETIMYTLLFNKNTHLVSLFKDYMIYDYVDEFLKRYYQTQETEDRLPKFAVFYKNYLTFFCQPCFTSSKYNYIIQRNREKKAELFYNKNFREKNKESNEDEGIIEDSEEDEDYEIGKSWIEKTIFNETVKKYIEKYSPINTSMVLPESETKLKSDESGLLTSFDNQSSLRNIIKNMKKKKKIDKSKNQEEELSDIIKKDKNDKLDDNKDKEKLNDNIHKTNYYYKSKNQFHKIQYNDKNKKEYKINLINNSDKISEINKDAKEINIINIKNKRENNPSKNEERNSHKSSISKNNKSKQPVYIKKIEMIKISKARSNSNRNSNFKEKNNSNKNFQNNDNNRNIVVNHSQNIINMINHIKNMDNHKKTKSGIQPYRKKSDNRTSINSNTNKLKKNFSEKEFTINNKLNLDNKNKKCVSRNKRKTEDILDTRKMIDINFETKNNNNNFNKIKTCYGQYNRKAISKGNNDNKMEENNHDLKNKNKNLKLHNYNNSNIIFYHSNQEKIKKQLNNNMTQIQGYQNISRSRNSFNNINHNHYSSSNNNNNTSYNFNMNNKKRINSNMQTRYKSSSFYSNNNSRQKTYDFVKTKNRMRSKNQSNRISLNLLKTQNVEVILSQIKLLRPKIINKKVTQKNSENKIRKYTNNHMNLISFENINMHNNTNINYNNKNKNNENYNKNKINRICTKLIKKNKFNTTNKITIYNNNKNLRYNRLKVSASEYELNHMQLNLNKKSYSLKNLKSINNKNNILFNSNNDINNMNILNKKKIFNSNLQNFNKNIPRQSKNIKGKNKMLTFKNTKINTMNSTFNQKISCESSNVKGLNYTNITNNTNSNNNTNINTNTPNNRDEDVTKKNLSTFFIDNNNNNQNMNNKSYFKEEIGPQCSPLKHIHNVNININNQININNNDIIAINSNKSSILISKNIKIPKNKKNDRNIPNNKKIMISRNKKNSLEYNSLNSFLSANSNYTNLKRSYLNKKVNPINLLVSSNNSNIKETKKTTIYLHNFDKNKTMKNNYNNGNNGNYSSNIILLDNKRIKNNMTNKKSIKQNISNNNNTLIRLKNNKNSNTKNTNIKSNNKNIFSNSYAEKKIMKKSSTYQILPK